MSRNPREVDPAPPGVDIVICETCRAPRHAHQEGRHGPLLAAHVMRALERASAASSRAGVRVVTIRCLWACTRGCNAHLRSHNRSGYVLCDLDPDERSADALVRFASLYARSEDGAVAFSQWPEALRGHFLCRIPATGAGTEVRG